MKAVAREKQLDAIAKPLERGMQRIFRKQGRLFLPLLAKHKGLFVEAGTYAGWSFIPDYAKPGTMLYEALDQAKLQRILDRIEAETSEEMRATLHTTSAKAYGAGIEAGSDLAAGISFSVHHPAAVEWLESHAAEMVTEINSTTRDFIGNVVTQGVDEGWSYNRMAREIKGRYEEFAVGQPQAHIRSRAELVAVTESHKAYGEGHRAGLEPLTKLGVEMEMCWVTMGDDLVSDGCLENEAVLWIPIDDTFPSGDQTEPRFPSCRCNVQYQVKPIEGGAAE